MTWDKDLLEAMHEVDQITPGSEPMTRPEPVKHWSDNKPVILTAKVEFSQVALSVLGPRWVYNEHTKCFTSPGGTILSLEAAQAQKKPLQWLAETARELERR